MFMGSCIFSRKVIQIEQEYFMIKTEAELDNKKIILDFFIFCPNNLCRELFLENAIQRS